MKYFYLFFPFYTYIDQQIIFKSDHFPTFWGLYILSAPDMGSQFIWQNKFNWHTAMTMCFHNSSELLSCHKNGEVVEAERA